MDDGVFTSEFFEHMRAHDSRYRAIERMVNVEAELRDSVVLRMVCDVAAADAKDARKALEEVDPLNTREIYRLQAMIRFPRVIEDVVAAVIRSGQAAQQELNEEAQDMRGLIEG